MAYPCPSHAARNAPVGAADWRGLPNVRLPIPIAAFRALGRLSQLSAINRHNRRLFDHLVRAPGYRKAKRLGGRRAGRGGTVNEPCGTPGAASQLFGMSGATLRFGVLSKAPRRMPSVRSRMVQAKHIAVRIAQIGFAP